MKTKFIILLTVGSLLGCSKESILEENQANLPGKNPVTQYLQNLKSSSNDAGVQKLDELIQRIKIDPATSGRVTGEEASENFIIVDVESLPGFKTSEIIKAVFWKNNDKIAYGSIIAFEGQSTNYTDLTKDIYTSRFEPSNYSGTISVYDIYQNKRVSNVIENGKLKQRGIATSKEPVTKKGARTAGCIDWYWVTTTYYSNGTTSSSSEYAFTTCNGDCQNTRAGRTTCGGSGGGPGAGGPTFPTTPSNGDKLIFTQPNGVKIEYRYNAMINVWEITMTTLPTSVVTSSSYSFLQTDSPPETGFTVRGSDGFVYLFDGYSGTWGGLPTADYDSFDYPLNAQEREFFATYPYLKLSAAYNRKAAEVHTSNLFLNPLGDSHNGNAFKHALWSAFNARSWSWQNNTLARDLGIRHESSEPHDKRREMDLHNNDLGISLAYGCTILDGVGCLIDRILPAINGGSGKRLQDPENFNSPLIPTDSSGQRQQ